MFSNKEAMGFLPWMHSLGYQQLPETMKFTVSYKLTNTTQALILANIPGLSLTFKHHYFNLLTDPRHKQTDTFI